MLYKSPLIFIKVRGYYVFNGEVTPACMESMCSSHDLSSPGPSSSGRGLRLALPFCPREVLGRLSWSSCGPLPSTLSSTGAGTWLLPRWGGGAGVGGVQNSCWFTYCRGTEGPGPLTRLLGAQHCPCARSGSGEEQGGQPS